MIGRTQKTCAFYLRQSLTLLPIVLLCVAVTSCTGHPESDVNDLTRFFSNFTYLENDPTLDLRSKPPVAIPAPGLSMVLDQGWWHSESFGTWAVGYQASVDVFLREPEDRTLSIDCRSFPPAPGDLPQVMTISLNGQELGREPLPKTWRHLLVDVPKESQKTGRNSLVFDFASVRSSPDNTWRALAVGFRNITITRDAISSGHGSTETLGSAPARSATTFAFSGQYIIPVRFEQKSTKIRFSAHARAGECTIGLSVVDFDGHHTIIGSDTAGPERDLAMSASLIPRPHQTLQFLVADVDLAPAAICEVTEAVVLSEKIPPPMRQKTCPVPETPPDVIVVIADALRPDHLSLSGYQRETSPFLDLLAQQSLVFANVVATASYSLASVASIISGQSAVRHHVVEKEHKLRDDIVTLAERFKEAGYATIGLSANAFHSPQFGSDQGYETFIKMWEKYPKSDIQAGDPHRAVAEVQKSLTGRFSTEKPLFLLMHLVPPHTPYNPAAQFDIFTSPDYRGPASGDVQYLHDIISGDISPSPQDIDHLIALYDGNIRRVDDAIRELTEVLKSTRKRSSNTVFLVIADHGEAFGEHNWFGHTGTVYEEMVRVPFILRLPPGLDVSHINTHQLLSLADIYPSLLDLAGIEAGDEIDGRSLFRTHADDGDRLVVIRNGGFEKPTYAMRSQRWKAIVHDLHQRELYDLEVDPQETINGAFENRFLMAGFEALLSASLRSQPVQDASAASLSPEELKALRALGYFLDAPPELANPDTIELPGKGTTHP